MSAGVGELSQELLFNLLKIKKSTGLIGKEGDWVLTCAQLHMRQNPNPLDSIPSAFLHYFLLCGPPLANFHQPIFSGLRRFLLQRRAIRKHIR